MATATKKEHLMATVRKLRMALDDTQQEFATRLGMAISTVVRFEHTRAPSGKALAKLEQVAATHGFDEYAVVFRQALSEQLGSAPPSPSKDTVLFKNDEEKTLVNALLEALRRSVYEKKAKQIRGLLAPVARELQSETEFSEALEASRTAILRLLKQGHTPQAIVERFRTSPEHVADALFSRGSRELFEQFNDSVLAVCIKEYGIKCTADRLSVDVEDVINVAYDHGLHDALSSYERDCESGDHDEEGGSEK